MIRLPEEFLAFEAISDTRDSVFQMGLIKIDQETQFDRDLSDIIGRGLFEQWNDSFDRFKLYENFSLYEQISAKPHVQQFTSVKNWNRFLSFDVQAVLAKFYHQSRLVN